MMTHSNHYSEISNQLFGKKSILEKIKNNFYIKFVAISFFKTRLFNFSFSFFFYLYLPLKHWTLFFKKLIFFSGSHTEIIKDLLEEVFSFSSLFYNHQWWKSHFFFNNSYLNISISWHLDSLAISNADTSLFAFLPEDLWHLGIFCNNCLFHVMSVQEMKTFTMEMIKHELVTIFKKMCSKFN